MDLFLFFKLGLKNAPGNPITYFCLAKRAAQKPPFS